jgi:molybdenum cofactor sulfurtransferase
MTTFGQQMKDTLLGNPHSSSSTLPNAAHQIIETTRLKVLDLFNANPEHFEVVFVANATAGIKLVAEAFSGYTHGFDYLYHRDSHTSLIGVRELATTSRCLENDDDVENWIAQDVCDKDTEDRALRLFSYPGQSNMNGRRLPLAWPALLRCTKKKPATYTLLDIAALASTGTVDLSNHTTAPDFLVLSFYKIFGFPDLGALIIRKEASHVFDHRKYFGGGTTGMITCRSTSWVVRKDSCLSDRLEDGTGPTHSILALRCAIDTHNQLFGSQAEVSKHTSFLARHLYEGLEGLKHTNGTPVVTIYKDPISTHGDPRTQGATVTFNVRNANGELIASTNVGAIAAHHRILLRAGGMCNPVGMAQAIGLSDDDIQTAYAAGFRCSQPNDIHNGVPFGMVRASLGAMSTMRDVEVLLRFIEEYFVHGHTEVSAPARRSFDEKMGFKQLRERMSSMTLRNKRSGALSGSKSTPASSTLVASSNGRPSDESGQEKRRTSSTNPASAAPTQTHSSSPPWFGRFLCGGGACRDESQSTGRAETGKDEAKPEETRVHREAV